MKLSTHNTDKFGSKGIIFKPTGDTINDNILLKEIVEQLNTWKTGTLWIDGWLKLTQKIIFQGNISCRGIGSYSGIESMDQSSPFVWVGHLPVANGIGMQPTERFSESFIPSLPVKKGDWVVTWANNNIPEMLPHFTDGKQCPMELHQVYHFIKNKTAVVESFIVDELKETPQYSIVEMLRGVVVDNLTFKVSDDFTPASYGAMLTFYACEDLHIEKCHFERHGTGGVYLKGCANAYIQGNNFNGIATADGIYQIVTGLCNGVHITDNRIVGGRHTITTSGGRGSGTTRWGNVLNRLFKNNIVEAPPKGTDEGFDNDGFVAVDSHSEGWGDIIDGNIINIGGNGSGGGYGISIRARNTIVTNNRIVGYRHSSGVPSLGVGVNIYGPDAKVKNNHFQNLTYGIVTHARNEGCWSHGLEATSNTFRDISYGAISLRAGDHHIVDQNVFIRCGSIAGGVPQQSKCHIQLGMLYQCECAFEKNRKEIVSENNRYYPRQQIFFTSTKKLPPEIQTGKKYFIRNRLLYGMFTISETEFGPEIVFSSAGTGTTTAHGPYFAGTGVKICNNVSHKEENDHFIETSDGDVNNVRVYGNTVIGYGSELFSDRYGFAQSLLNVYGDLNLHT